MKAFRHSCKSLFAPKHLPVQMAGLACVFVRFLSILSGLVGRMHTIQKALASRLPLQGNGWHRAAEEEVWLQQKQDATMTIICS